ncbi:hypothetical protein O6H91_01G176100 [Diphasiastrum complanatum]|uniref:Uncharacterized protein n=2 Tax=Diphasiastrum complanatum TaxID=34168 RepID=A0ACC2EZ88_DIPCM|nr:hypothetical protein O6H91_01G176100 [Diphasiastrum complanatum]
MELVRKKLKRSTFDYADMGEEEKGHLPCLEGLNGKGWSGDKQIDKKVFNFANIDSGCGDLKSTHDNDYLQRFEVEPLSKGKEPKRETPRVKVESSSKMKIECQMQEKKVAGAVVEASNCQMGESWTNFHFPSLDLVASIKEMARERMISSANESFADILRWRALRAIGRLFLSLRSITFLLLSDVQSAAGI